jgi:hypothetical protein
LVLARLSFFVTLSGHDHLELDSALGVFRCGGNLNLLPLFAGQGAHCAELEHWHCLAGVEASFGHNACDWYAVASEELSVCVERHLVAVRLTEHRLSRELQAVDIAFQIVLQHHGQAAAVAACARLAFAGTFDVLGALVTGAALALIGGYFVVGLHTIGRPACGANVFAFFVLAHVESAVHFGGRSDDHEVHGTVFVLGDFFTANNHAPHAAFDRDLFATAATGEHFGDVVRLTQEVGNGYVALLEES